jgi:hypothetical protein
MGLRARESVATAEERGAAMTLLVNRLLLFGPPAEYASDLSPL